MIHDMKPLSLLIIVLAVFVSDAHAATESICDKPLGDTEVAALFKQSVLRQLALEFGESGLFVYAMQQTPVDASITRVEAFAKYKKLGQKDLATMRVKGWVSRCEGTTIVRGNTWLADGTLVAPRYALQQLPGKGVQLGNPNAAIQVIVYVDSRCPHCHRLLGYAKTLLAEGKLFVDIRQVAYLESTEEALQDARLFETAVVNAENPVVTIGDYVEMLSGFNSDSVVNSRSPHYSKAKAIIDTNTKTAMDILHIISVPGVLLREPRADNQYREVSYWEMNRIFQPDL